MFVVKEHTFKQINSIKSEPKIKQLKKQARYRKEASYR